MGELEITPCAAANAPQPQSAAFADVAGGEPGGRQAAAVVFRAEPWIDQLDGASNRGWTNPHVVLERRSVPSPAAGQLLIRLLRVGICGTDLHLLETRPDGRIRCSSPFTIPAEGRVIGHEGVGVVAAVGPDTPLWHAGDLACLESILVCGECVPCRRGMFNQCARASLLGLQTDGLFQEWVVVPSRLAHRVNDLAGSPAERDGLACVEPAAVAFLACQNARVAPADHVLVIGGGPIGYLAALLARQVFGAARVTLSEPMRLRREFARLACDVTVTPEELHAAATRFDVVIEAAGALPVIDSLLPRLKPNSRIVLLARTGTPLEIHQVDELITKGVTISGSRGHLGGAFAAVIELIRCGKLDLRQVVTRVVPGWNGLVRALEDPARLVREECKVIADLEEEAVVG